MNLHIASILKDYTQNVSTHVLESEWTERYGYSQRKCFPISSSQSYPRHMAMLPTPMMWRCFPRQCPVNRLTSTLVLFLQLDRSKFRRCSISVDFRLYELYVESRQSLLCLFLTWSHINRSRYFWRYCCTAGSGPINLLFDPALASSSAFSVLVSRRKKLLVELLHPSFSKWRVLAWAPVDWLPNFVDYTILVCIRSLRTSVNLPATITTTSSAYSCCVPASLAL